MLEVLEDRRLLSTLDITGGALTYTADPSSASDLTVSIDPSDTADVIFTDADQLITLSGAGTSDWTGDGTNTVTGPTSSYASMAIGGSTAMGQILTIDYSGSSTADPLPASGLTYTPAAASGPATNTLDLISGAGGTTFLSESYLATGAGAGTIMYSDSANSNVPITFSGLSPVTDTVPSPTFIFDAPAAATTVNVTDGPPLTKTEINDGGTGAFELIDFANKTAATVNVNNAGATTTVDTTTASTGLSSLFVNSGAGNDKIVVQATPTGVTTTTDTGSVNGSTTSIGLGGLLTSILGPVVVQSTGSTTNTLTVDDSAETVPTTYTLSGSAITATSFPTTITLGGTGIKTLNLDSSGNSTVNLDQLAQGGVATYNFTGGTALGASTLNVSSDVATLNYGTAGTLTFGAGQPTIHYTNFPTVNVTKLATAPVGTATTITGKAGQDLNNVVVATFTEADLANKSANFVASINWGDSTTSTGSITPDGTGGYEVTGSHTYAAGGSYTVDVTLTDQNTSGTTTVGGTTINVTSNGPVLSTPSPIVSTANISPTLLPNSVYALTGATLTGVMQDVQTTQDVATFKSTDTSAVPADFTATINWGDGTPPTAGIITEDASDTFHVTGTHTYTTAGSFTPTVTIKDINGTVYTTGGPLYQTNLVSSEFGQASVIEPNLIDPWGMASSPAGPIWVADEGSGVATVYNPNSSPITPIMTIPIPSATGVGTGSPTGIVFNSDTTPSDFPVSAPGSGSATFLFATLDGTIAAWNKSLGTSGPAVTVTKLAGGVFTGLALADDTTTGSYYLYAANFNPTSGTAGIVVFDPAYTNVTSTTFAGKFVDPHAIAGYNPYNIASLGGDLYVSYAKPTGAAGTFTASDGYIDEFSTNGAFIARIYTDTTGTNLNGPWAMVIAPAGFGTVGGDLLVGNFGDGTATAPSGTISAIDLTTGAISTLGSPNGTIDNAGQWGLLFGNGGSGGSAGALYLSAGIVGQTRGLFTAISTAASPSVTVAAAPLTAMGTTIMGIEGNPLTTSAAGVLVATFMDTGTPGAAASYTATINWGDGSSTTAGTITSQGTPDGTVYSVFGNHTYVSPGTYPVSVTITNTANGAIAVASSQAVIADAALTPTAAQPTASTTEDTVFSGPVGSFTDADPSAPISDYDYVMIYWGDGTPATAGTISQPGGVGTAFVVSGTHTYADAGVNGGTGHYPITVDVSDIDGASTTIANTANVADVPLTVTGKLNPASDSGISNTDDITDVVQPNFFGTTNQPFATISLYATMSGSTTPVLIGTGVSDASDAWSITSDQPLANGGYTITAVAMDSSGNTVSSTTTIVPNLVIDTVGPKVTSVSFNRFQGQIVVTFQDFGGVGNAGSGMDLASVIDAANYQLVTSHHPRVGKYVVNVLSDVPGTTAGTQTVTLSINGGKYIKGGWYDLTIFAASPSMPSGVQDIAGNALDGEFYGYFPSGNNIPGGNFVAQLTAIHHTIFAPSTIIGRGTPVHPPGTRQGTILVSGTVNPSKLHRSSSFAAARSRAAQKAADKVDHHSHPTVASSSRTKAPRQASTKVVHHTAPALSHLVHQAGGRPAATSSSSGSQDNAMGALGTLDQALDQLGGAKHSRS